MNAPRAPADPERISAESAPGPRLEPAAARWIVDDDVAPAAGQMSRSSFVEALHARAAVAVEGVSTGTAWTTEGCPWMATIFAYYRRRSAAEVERGLQRWAPEAALATTAAQVLDLAVLRVQVAARLWSLTGQLPDIASVGLPDFAGAAAVQRIARPGAGAASAPPDAVASRLGRGQPLDSGSRSRMESAFGESFGDVQIHADSRGGTIAQDLGATAFAVGTHVVFAPGEWHPGTPTGDAVLAHELAHVLQQRGAGPGARAAAADGVWEQRADSAAAIAVRSIWAGEHGSAAAAAGRLGGLGLQRCRRPAPAPIPEPTSYTTYGAWLAAFPVPASSSTEDITARAPAGLRTLIETLGADCADVAMVLRHYYLAAHRQTQTFTIGRTTYRLGHGVTLANLRVCLRMIGSVNVQEGRRGHRMITYYTSRGRNIKNLKHLVDAGLTAGDLFVWRRREYPSAPAAGHVQTIQSVDRTRQTISFAEGTMEHGTGAGVLNQRINTFAELTGVADGDHDVIERSWTTDDGHPAHNDFWGGGHW